jgi:ubiquinone/menaquinone biosynthesis C-methylase UbiE
LFTLAKKGANMTGVEKNKKKIALLKNISRKLGLNTKIISADLRKLPFKNNSFDKIISSDVFEHIKEDKKALKELLRVVRINGFILLTFPSNNKFNKKEQHKFGHVRPGYNPRDVANLIESMNANARIVKIKGYISTVSRLCWRLNQALFKSKILTALAFYPLYWLTFIDYIFAQKNKIWDGYAAVIKKTGK